MHIKQAVIEVRRLSGQCETIETRPTGRTAFQSEETAGVLRFAHEGPGLIGTLDLDVAQRMCNASDNLALAAPVTIKLYPHQLPEAITAFYIYDDWWTRPAFCRSFSEVPPYTQVALLRYPNRYACLVPMVGRVFKTVMAPGGDDFLTLELRAGKDGQAGVHEPLFSYAEAETAGDAVKKVFSFLACESGIREREERPYPEVFEYLGWCSWDAFYKDLDEKGMRDKAAELHDKDVPVRWAILDDGWLTVKDEMLWDFAPDPRKFPEGFARMIREIRQDSMIRWFGAWHSIDGYWAAIHPDSPLAETQKDHLLFAGNGRVLPYPEAGRAYGFYHDWHQLLRQEGIDFVKVDVQNAVANHYQTETSLCRASHELQLGLEAGTACMENTIINCMGMAMENILSRPTSAISRNSDDFFPERAGSFREHLLQNAYNAVYHGELYWCDWDMFWTSHPDAARHAVLRAVSGGPVYCSDRVGETDPEVLRPLAYLDGRLLRLHGTAAATEDCLFRDPFSEGVLKIANTGTWGGHMAGALACYNLTEEAQTCTFSPCDIPDLEPAAQYILWDWFKKTAACISPQDSITRDFEKDEFSLFIFLPAAGSAVCLGRTDKYAGFTAVEASAETEDGFTAVVHEQGPVSFVTEKRISCARCSGTDVTEQLSWEENSPGVYTLNLPVRPHKAILDLRWDS